VVLNGLNRPGAEAKNLSYGFTALVERNHIAITVVTRLTLQVTCWFHIRVVKTTSSIDCRCSASAAVA